MKHTCLVRDRGSYDTDSDIAAAQSAVLGAPNEELAAQLGGAERRALEARAAYMLQNRLVEHALIAGPVRKAVHAESNTNVAER